MNKLTAVLAAGALTAGSIALAAPAQAFEPFYRCAHNVGRLSLVTSCPFAEEVAAEYPYTHTAYGVVLRQVPSVVTGQSYDMFCDPGTITFYDDDISVPTEICRGGNDAVVSVL